MQKTPLLYKWFNPMGSVVIIQMTLLRGREKQCQYFFLCWKDHKGEADHTCGLINNSTRTARRMNFMHIAQLFFFFQGRNGREELWFLLFLCSDPSLGDMAGLERPCQNLKCDPEWKSLEYDKDLSIELYFSQFPF